MAWVDIVVATVVNYFKLKEERKVRQRGREGVREVQGDELLEYYTTPHFCTELHHSTIKCPVKLKRQYGSNICMIR